MIIKEVETIVSPYSSKNNRLSIRKLTNNI